MVFEAKLMDARKEGYNEGLEKGLEQGIEQGIELGIAEAVRRLDHKGIAHDEISQFLNVDIDTVEQILRLS